MEVTDDLGMYLGMPTLTSRVTYETFAYLCEKIDRRLAGWKSKYLSLAGRITLAKSTLNNLAFYSMQTAKLPRLVCDEIDKKTRRFVWGGDEETRKIHLISWENLQKDKAQGGLGLRSSRQSNAAFLTKLGWRILAEPNALWARVLRQKYCKGRCDIDMFEPKTNMSNVWRGITDNASILKRGVAKALGNGRSTRFWDDIWAIDTTLRDVCTAHIPEELENSMVHELWEEGTGWKWQLFGDLFSQETLKHIASHEIVEDDSVGDLMYWKGSKKGGFSIKYALKLIRNEVENSNSNQWDLVWKAPVQQRVRVLLWLIMHDRLLCNSNRLKRHLTNDPRCPRCGGADETLIHLLRECPHSRNIWHLIGGLARQTEFFQDDLQAWIVKNLKADQSKEHYKWPSIFGVTIWWIWRWRNNITFNKPEDIPHDIFSFLLLKFEEQLRAVHLIGPAIAPVRGPACEIFVQWRAPPFGWFALNTDGASKGNPGAAGGGGVIRDSNGCFIRAFSANYGTCSSYKAEMKAILHGLQMAQSLGVTNLVIQVDNQACVHILSNYDYQGGECYNIINQSRTIIRNFGDNYSLIHCYRESNRIADLLANKGVQQENGFVYWHEAPNEITTLLHEDFGGFAIPRLVHN